MEFSNVSFISLCSKKDFLRKKVKKLLMKNEIF